MVAVQALLMNYFLLGLHNEPHINDVTVSRDLGQDMDCGFGCGKCSPINGCLMCKTSLYLVIKRSGPRQTAACSSVCPRGFYKLNRKKHGFCTRCMLRGCSVCSSRHFCSVCDEGLARYSGRCYKRCPPSTHYHPHYRLCLTSKLINNGKNDKKIHHHRNQTSSSVGDERDDKIDNRDNSVIQELFLSPPDRKNKKKVKMKRTKCSNKNKKRNKKRLKCKKHKRRHWKGRKRPRKTNKGRRIGPIISNKKNDSKHFGTRQSFEKKESIQNIISYKNDDLNINNDVIVFSPLKKRSQNKKMKLLQPKKRRYNCDIKR